MRLIRVISSPGEYLYDTNQTERDVLPAGAPETLAAALRFLQLGHLHNWWCLDPFQNKLSNPHPNFDLEAFLAQVENHNTEVPAVVLIHYSSAEIDTVLQSQPATRCNTAIRADRYGNC